MYPNITQLVALLYLNHASVYRINPILLPTNCTVTLKALGEQVRRTLMKVILTDVLDRYSREDKIRLLKLFDQAVEYFVVKLKNDLYLQHVNAWYVMAESS